MPSRLPALALLALTSSVLTAALACKPSASESPASDASRASGDTSTEAAASESPALREEIEHAAAGVEDEALAALLREDWRRRLEAAPLFATQLGVHDFDSGWGPRGPEARAARAAERDALLGEARELGNKDALSEADRLTLELFVAELESSQARQVCEFWAWNVSFQQNPLGEIAEAAMLGDSTSPEDLLARYRSFPAVVDATLADLRDGLARGLVADGQTLQRTAEMLERQLDTPIDDWTLLDPVKDAPADDPHALALRAAVVDEVEPALRRFAVAVREELLPAGREGERSGVSALPNGPACYAALIQHHLSEPGEAEAIHALGLEQIALIDEEFRVLGAKVFKTRKLAKILTRLRTDPSLYFETSEEVEAFARDSLAAAEAAAPKWFTHLPKTPCEVRRIPDHEAPFTTIAYYRQPGAETPGAYYINTYAPTTRPRYEARVLAIHEAVPGHHTQIALAQELPDAPAFRRHGGTTVFVEGWALYTERLADEMGLYTTDLDRLGVLSFDAWRAARLVVDTGIHAKGWTREQAIAFMLEHTALAENNIVNEVDRYVSWPGQALAYKYGQLELLRLRADAEAQLGPAFDVASFHEVVLGAGALSLPLLRQRVAAWVESRAASPE